MGKLKRKTGLIVGVESNVSIPKLNCNCGTVFDCVDTELKSSVEYCTSRLNLFSNELKILLAQIEIISKWIHGQFGIEVFNRESVLLHHSHDFREIQEIAQLLTSTVSFENHRRAREFDSEKEQNTAETECVRTDVKEELTSEFEVDRNLNLSNFGKNEAYTNKKIQKSRTKTKHTITKHETTNNTIVKVSTEINNTVNLMDFSDSDNESKSETVLTATTNRVNVDVDGATKSALGKIQSQYQCQCDECGKILSSEKYLSEHKKIHSNTRPFKCNICGKSFLFNSKLQMHGLIHLGQKGKKLQCRFCGKLFKVRRDLARHERTHTGEKPYTCHVCSKSFNDKQHLTFHIRTHTGEKPYNCTVCNKNFSQANTLRLHKKLHEGNRYVPPSVLRKKALRKANKIKINPSSFSVNSSISSNFNPLPLSTSNFDFDPVPVPVPTLQISETNSALEAGNIIQMQVG